MAQPGEAKEDLVRFPLAKTPEAESLRTHFEVLGLDLKDEVLGLGLEASRPRKLPCPRLEDSTIF